MTPADSPENPPDDRPDADEEYPLAVPDQEPAEREPATPQATAPAPEVEEPRENLSQFSLAEAFAILVVLSLFLGIMRTFPRNWAAFVTGIVVFLSLIAISALKVERLIIHVGWWAMLVVYVLICIAAIVSGN